MSDPPVAASSKASAATCNYIIEKMSYDRLLFECAVVSAKDFSSFFHVGIIVTKNLLIAQ